MTSAYIEARNVPYIFSIRMHWKKNAPYLISLQQYQGYKADIDFGPNGIVME